MSRKAQLLFPLGTESHKIKFSHENHIIPKDKHLLTFHTNVMSIDYSNTDNIITKTFYLHWQRCLWFQTRQMRQKKHELFFFNLTLQLEKQSLIDQLSIVAKNKSVSSLLEKVSCLFICLLRILKASVLFRKRFCRFCMHEFGFTTLP